MSLLDDVEVPKQQSKASLTKQATRLIGRRKTRRGKKKKQVKSAKWKREFAQALKKQNAMKANKKQFARQQKELDQMDADFKRLIL